MFKILISEVSMECVTTSKSTIELSYESMTIDGEAVELAKTDPFVAQLKEFCAAIEAGRRSMPDARDGLMVLEVITALQKSSREQIVVSCQARR